MAKAIQLRVPGKWVLSGEHAVLRGGSAIVSPVPKLALDLTYQSTNEMLTAQFSGESADAIGAIFWRILELALQILPGEQAAIRGRLELHNSLPIGAGLGFSAALSVAFARWLSVIERLDSVHIFSFARALEDQFHGESSGLDIAGCLASKPVLYQSGQAVMPLVMRWQPRWVLTRIESPSVTAHCIKRVADLRSKNPQRGDEIDARMVDSVVQATQALSAENAAQGLPALCAAIAQAKTCFLDWGLVSAQMAEHMAWIEKQGAVAVKPTGAGLGGHVLSMWTKPVPETLSAIVL